jgi:hypothetical protein
VSCLYRLWRLFSRRVLAMRCASCHHAIHVRRPAHSTWYRPANTTKAEDQRPLQVPWVCSLEKRRLLVHLSPPFPFLYPSMFLLPAVRWASCLERLPSRVPCCQATRLLQCPAPPREQHPPRLAAHQLRCPPQQHHQCNCKVTMLLSCLRSPCLGSRLWALLSSSYKRSDQGGYKLVNGYGGEGT